MMEFQFNMSPVFPRRGEGVRPEEPKPVAQEAPKVKEVIPEGYEAWKVEGKPVEIFSKNEVLAGIWDHCAQSRQTRQEVGGILYGQIFHLPDNKQKFYIEAFEPMFDPNSHERGFSFKGREFKRVCHAARRNYPKWSNDRGFGVGWWHTHLNPDPIFLSPPDRSNHSFFCQVSPDKEQVALVVQTDQGSAGFFINEEGEIKQWHRSYHEFFIENLAERVKRGDI